MSYYVYQHDTVFRIPAELIPAAHAALIGLGDEMARNCSWLEARHYKTFDEELWRNYDWNVEIDPATGDIVGIEFDGATFHDEDAVFSAIAPYVEAGSYITMSGEDDSWWCWYFDGSTCDSYPGTVVFPGVPGLDRAEN